MANSVWDALGNLEENLYKSKNIISISSDALLNDNLRPDNEALSSTLSLVEGLIRECQDEVEYLYKQRKYFHDSPERDEYREMDESLEDEEGTNDGGEIPEEVISEAEKDYVRPDTRSFNVVLAEEHEDGSATYTVNGSSEAMANLFQTMICSALINGIKYTEEGNKRFESYLKNEAAIIALLTALKRWEEDDEFDYDPVVKALRKHCSDRFGV